MSTSEHTGILKSNPSLISKVQDWIKENVDYSRAELNRKPYSFRGGICHFDCQLPSLTLLCRDAFAKYKMLVIDSDMMDDLQKAKVLNWCGALSTLHAVKVPRDGNCLLHSASFAMWGVDDRGETLRQLLLMTLQNDYGNQYRTRWCRQQLQDAQNVIQTEKEAMMQEWEDIVDRVASTASQAASAAVPHKFLESLHVYVLCNILRRPIIIISDCSARSIDGTSLQENNIGGIYLPLEWNRAECSKTPLIIGYTNTGCHFSPLLSEFQMDSTRKQMFPLVTQDMNFLPVRFLKQEEETVVWELLQDYLVIKDEVSGQQGVSVLCVVMSLKPMPFHLNAVEMHYQQFVQRSKKQVPAVYSHFHHSQSVETQQSRVAANYRDVVPPFDDDLVPHIHPPVVEPPLHSSKSNPFYHIQVSSQTVVSTYVRPVNEAHKARLKGLDTKKSKKQIKKDKEKNVPPAEKFPYPGHPNAASVLEGVLPDEFQRHFAIAEKLTDLVSTVKNERNSRNPTKKRVKEEGGLAFVAEKLNDFDLFFGGDQMSKTVTEQIKEKNTTVASNCITPGCKKSAGMNQGGLCDGCLENLTIAESGTELVSIGEGDKKFYVSKQGEDRGNTSMETEPGVPVVYEFQLDTGPPPPATLVPTAPPPSGNFPSHAPETLSLMSTRCANGCGYRCSKHTFPYCHECHDRLQSNTEVVEQPTALLPSSSKVYTPPSGDGWQKVGHDQKNIQVPPISSTMQEMPSSMPADVPVRSGDQGDISNNAVRVVTENMSSKIKEHCNVVKAEASCHSDHAQKRQQVQCSSPFCVTMIQPTEGVCHNCKEILRTHSPSTTQVDESPHGQNVPNGFVKLQTENHKDTISVPPGNTQPKSPLGELDVMQLDSIPVPSDTRNVSKKSTDTYGRVQKKHLVRGKLCISPGCSYFGDPANADMCSSCFHRNQPSKWNSSAQAVAEENQANSYHKHSKTTLSCTGKTQHISRSQGVDNEFTKVPIFQASLKEFSKLPRFEAFTTATTHLPVSSACEPTDKSKYGFTHQSYTPMSLNLSPSSEMATSLSRAPQGFLHAHQPNLTGPESLNPSDVPPGVDFVSIIDNDNLKGYKQMLQAFERELKKCRTHGCPSYGNDKSSGYCNECYLIYSLQEKEHLRTDLGQEDVPDN
ncbi:uncharacterized protein LOC101847463 [Aplysia californica]|uniref:ubiquitinyl hydrolase 1 n=1 Tax=Aplysia californica TaxID=6500 RepID=A0ABM0JBS4_APLCA|nr:uncharacterized protein LOC101847463 [Aplysia californica]